MHCQNKYKGIRKVSNFYNRQTRIKNQRTQKLRSIHDDTMRTSGVELEVAKNEIITTLLPSYVNSSKLLSFHSNFEN